MNVLTGSKHCFNPHGTTITLFLSLIRGKLSCKRSALVWCEILKLCVKTLTADDKYSGTNMQSLPQQIQTPLSQKQKTFFWIFYCISEMCMKFGSFSKKRWVCWPNYFWNYWCWKTWLLTHLKGLAWEHHSLMNVITDFKHCWNQHGTTTTLFSRQFEINWVEKSLFYSIWNLKTVC